MRVNIYIRKENEAKWLGLGNKSDWINTLLENKVLPELCEHGAGKGFCKNNKCKWYWGKK